MLFRSRYQEEINEAFSDYAYLDCVHGFVPGRSILSNAIVHANQKEVLNIDVQDFFGSVSVDYFFLLYEKLLEKFCKSEIELIRYFCFLNGALPQGAPTSPLFSNLFFEPLDRFFMRYAKENGWKYSRYADDLTFSGDNLDSDFDFDLIDDFLKMYGLKRNPQKTHLMRNGASKSVTGIVVNNESLSLGRTVRSAFFDKVKGRRLKDLNPSEIGYLNYIRSVSVRNYEQILRGLVC